MTDYSQSLANHLADQAEQLKTKGHRLPSGLHRRMMQLSRLSSLAKMALRPLLPEEVIEMLMVVNHTQTHLTLSVADATVANHLRYMQDACLNQLRMTDSTFAQLQHLKVVSVPDLRESHRVAQSQLTRRQREPHNLHRPSFKSFGENTKRTITQAIENVTPDSELAQELKKLFNQE